MFCLAGGECFAGGWRCDIVNVTIGNSNQVNIETESALTGIIVVQWQREISVKGAHTEMTLILSQSEIPARNSTVERGRERYGDCWYTGSVLEEAGSSVSVSVCDGLVRI